jgi:hypothetical protein
VVGLIAACGLSALAIPPLVTTLRLAASLTTSAYAELLTGPPAGTWPATYTLWLAAPSG